MMRRPSWQKRYAEGREVGNRGVKRKGEESEGGEHDNLHTRHRLRERESRAFPRQRSQESDRRG